LPARWAIQFSQLFEAPVHSPSSDISRLFGQNVSFSIMHPPSLDADGLHGQGALFSVCSCLMGRKAELGSISAMRLTGHCGFAPYSSFQWHLHAQ
jgi:hypothetical protein